MVLGIPENQISHSWILELSILCEFENTSDNHDELKTRCSFFSFFKSSVYHAKKEGPKEWLILGVFLPQ